jgi:hypothetical protein
VRRIIRIEFEIPESDWNDWRQYAPNDEVALELMVVDIGLFDLIDMAVGEHDDPQRFTVTTHKQVEDTPHA